MKPQPAPHIPGNTEAERMDAAVPQDVHRLERSRAKHEAKEKRQREKKRAKKSHA